MEINTINNACLPRTFRDEGIFAKCTVCSSRGIINCYLLLEEEVENWCSLIDSGLGLGNSLKRLVKKA